MWWNITEKYRSDPKQMADLVSTTMHTNSLEGGKDMFKAVSLHN